ncbi:MAG: hypothetical protein KDA22_14115 [Phycisphaerales bacterium]|nr:hypothetical protein [Phycisphaerales bacterium]
MIRSARLVVSAALALFVLSPASDLAAAPRQVCGRGGDCFTPHPGPGCDDVACCDVVCTMAPQCCEIAWDAPCVNLANKFCQSGPCDLPCPPGSFVENEPCGIDSVNPGCTVTPPLFQPIDCGTTVCGELWAQNGQHDEDWYDVFVPDPDGDGTTKLCIDFQSQIPAVLKIYSGTCSALNLLGQTQSDNCAAAQVCVCVPAPGTYLVRLFPGTIGGGPVNGGFPCPIPDRKYRLKTECTPDCAPTGACCYQEPGTTGFQCVTATQSECAALFNSTWYPNTPCSPDLCNAPQEGACCFVDATGVPTCATTTQAECVGLGGTWYPNTPCSADLCEPLGACCFLGPAGPLCNQTTSAECAALGGAWFPNTPCLLGLCDDQFGACCYVDPANGQYNCIVTSQADCQLVYGGAWYANTPCSAIQCPPPTDGACCIPAPGGGYTCIIALESECDEFAGSIWLGPNTTCADSPCPAGPCITAPSGMVAWYPLDEPVGPTAKDIVYGNHATHLPAANPPAPAPGFVAGGLKFDGVNDVALAPYAPQIDFDCGPFSIDAWIHPVSAPDPGGTIVSHHGGNPAAGYEFALDSNGNLVLFLETGCLRCVVSSSGAVAFNAWNHVAVTVSGCSTVCSDPCATGIRTVTFYINGVASGGLTGDLCCKVKTNAPLRMGDGTINGLFDGTLDEVEIFNRVLPASEVNALYAAGSSGKCKERCGSTWEAPCGPGGIATAAVTICNFAGVGQNYTWTMTPITGVPNTLCNITPGTITPNSGSMFVPAGQCVTTTVSVQCPTGAAPGSHGCFELCVTNVQTGKVFCCSGSIYIKKKWFIDPIEIFTPIPDPLGGVVGFHVTNEDDASGMLDFEVIAVPTDPMDENLAAPNIRLNGLPPGEPVIGTLSVMPGHSVDSFFDVFFDIGPNDSDGEPAVGNPDAFRLYDVLFKWDSDGNGVPEAVSSVGIQQKLPKCLGDYNADGVVNGADLGILLGGWGPNTNLDLNGDDVVNGADLGILLGNWGPCVF